MMEWRCILYHMFSTRECRSFTCALFLIWQWIAEFDIFYFSFQTLDELWLFDVVIPLKDSLLLELIRRVVLWVIWLEIDKVYFNGTKPASVKIIGTKILSFVLFGANLIEKILISNFFSYYPMMLRTSQTYSWQRRMRQSPCLSYC